MKLGKVSIYFLLVQVCFGLSFSAFAQVKLPSYSPTAFGVSFSGGLNYTSINGSRHIGGGLSFHPLLVSGVTVQMQRNYTPQKSLIVGLCYGSWGLNYGGMGFNHFNLVTIPTTAKYYFGDRSYRMRWFAELGPVVRFALVGPIASFSDSFARGYLGGQNEYYWKVKSRTRMQGSASPTFGALGKVGIEQRIDEQWQVGLSAYFHYGFQNLVENTFEASLSEEIPDADQNEPSPESFEIVQSGSLSIRGNTWGLMLHVNVHPFRIRKNKR